MKDMKIKLFNKKLKMMSKPFFLMNDAVFADIETKLDEEGFVFNEKDVIPVPCIGISDKHGVEIYFKDVIEIAGVERTIVEWDEQIAGFFADISFAERGWNEQVVDHPDSMEVIGSFLLNPELMDWSRKKDGK